MGESEGASGAVRRGAAIWRGGNQPGDPRRGRWRGGERVVLSRGGEAEGVGFGGRWRLAGEEVEEIIIRDLMRGGSRKWVEIEEGEADSFCLPFLLRGEGIRGHARRRQRGMGRDSATSPLSENRGASESCLTRGNPSAIARNVILFYPSCDLESSEQEILFFLFYPPVRLAGG